MTDKQHHDHHDPCKDRKDHDHGDWHDHHKKHKDRHHRDKCNDTDTQVPSCPQGFLYTVQPGDTMFLIAQRFGVSLQALINANPQIPNPNLIFPGQVICVPTGVGAPAPTCQVGFLYTVQPGDTMFLIAQRFGVNLNSLIAFNPQVPNPSLIFPGQVLCVPTGCPNGQPYTVQPGDTMFLIAQRFGISLQALINANPQVANPNLIFPGQQLCIPVRP
ncbi:MAG: peptidoglycan-binding protein LysM [Bacillota bacterium]|nr:MAG: peptidoglycan-binding protein LysM [Bacillota bacterium]